MRVLITRPEREATALATGAQRARPCAGHRAAVPARDPASAGRLRRGARRLPGGAAHQRQRRARAGRSERAARQADPGGGRHHGRDGRRAGFQRRRHRRRATARPWPTWCANASTPRQGRLSMCRAATSRSISARRWAATASRCNASRSTTRARKAPCPIRRGRRWRRARSMPPPSSRRAPRLLFARLVGEAGLADAVRPVTAIAISPAALAPLAALPFKASLAAARPTRQAVLDEIDRLAEAGVQGQATMTDTPSFSPASGIAASRARPACRSAAASA